MPNHRKARLAIGAIALVSTLLQAPIAAAEEGAAEAVRQRLQEIEPAFQPDEIRATEVDGLFEVVSGSRVFYVTGDGRFLLRGQLIDIENNRNLTAERTQALVRQSIESVGEDNMLVYRPRQGPAQHTITVFTDTSCPYCQRLHVGLLEMIEQYPVKVRYLMFPRAGLQADAADTMRDVWCAADPQQALTDAKAGREVAPRSENCETPIARHFLLGQEIGVTGTPYLLLDDHVVPGYRPNEVLLQMMGLALESEG